MVKQRSVAVRRIRTSLCKERGELLQSSHLPEAEHGTLSSSKRKVGNLYRVFRPAAYQLLICVANPFVAAL